jgi:hypothetical protein
MRRFLPTFLAIAVCAGFSGALLAQQPDSAVPQPPAAAKVDVVVSRTNGGKTLSNLPYSLNVAQGRPTSLRLGSQVPIPAAGKYDYHNVGTSIDCGDFIVLADGRYRLSLTIDDSSLVNENTPPVIRSYRISNSLILRNGETSTFNVATDKVSGDTIRAQVTVTALK